MEHLVSFGRGDDGPLPASGVRLGRGSAQFRTVAVGDMAGPDDVQSVHLNNERPCLELSYRGVGAGVYCVYWISSPGSASLPLEAWILECSGMPLLLLVLDMGLPVLGACVKCLYGIADAFYITLLFIVRTLLYVTGVPGSWRIFRFILGAGVSLIL